MCLRLFKKYSICIISLVLLLCCFPFAAFAEGENLTPAKEILLTADYPVDFDRTIIVTATCLDTGGVFTYYLLPETNYSTSEYIPYGRYSISAKVATSSEDTNDGTVYIVTPSFEILVVSLNSRMSELNFIVEGYTNTEQEDQDANNQQNPTNTTTTTTTTSTNVQNPPDDPNDDIENDNMNGSEDPPPSDDVDNNSDGYAIIGGKDMLRSLCFSALILVAFWIVGMLHRKHKEG